MLSLLEFHRLIQQKFSKHDVVCLRDLSGELALQEEELMQMVEMLSYLQFIEYSRTRRVITLTVAGSLANIASYSSLCRVAAEVN